jgi:hypothetical protein
VSRPGSPGQQLPVGAADPAEAGRVYHAAMQDRSGAGELGLAVAATAVLVHFVPAAPAGAVTGLIMLAAALGTAALAGERRPWRLPAISAVLPALAAFSVAGIARLVDPLPWLFFVFAAGWAALAGLVVLELLPAGDGDPLAPTPPAVRFRPMRRAEFDLPKIVAEPFEGGQEQLGHPRPLVVRMACLAMAFVAFTAVGGILPGGLAVGGPAPDDRLLAATFALDGLLGGALGYRIAAITRPSRYDRIVRILAFVQYGLPAAVVGVALRSIGLPRLFAPALLTLLVYMVTVLRDSPEPVLMNRRLLQELVVLGAVGLIAAAWGLLVR